ncbi:MAG: ChbG/HpnK family deacetylase, partial [Bacteroidales bacterium]|nr:ChbG/HpnK family deacetylase [Bacteroidales bacterium]
MKRKIILSAVILGIGTIACAQKLIIRGDDIGCTHGSNVGVILSYTDGIEQSAELMVVTPWLPEAVKMINEHPDLDVGVHVALTSEWETMKWRPLTPCPSLTDENGYFLPMTFPNKNYPGLSMTERKDKINLAEVEAELRAQIELARKLIPNLTHISGHMGWAMVHEGIPPIARRLSEEY